MPLTRAQLADQNAVFNEIRAHYAHQIGPWTVNNLKPISGNNWAAPPANWLNNAANQNAYSVRITVAKQQSYRVDILANDAAGQLMTQTVGILGA